MAETAEGASQGKVETTTELLILKHQFKEDEYIGGREMHKKPIVHIPELAEVSDAEGAHLVEAWGKGDTEEFVAGRLGLTTKEAKEVIKLLSRKGFDIGY